MLKTKRQKQRFIKRLTRVGLVLVVVFVAAWIFAPKVASLMGLGPKPPVFIFESSLAPGWTSEGNVNPKESMRKQYSADQVRHLPVASISVLQKESDDSNNCFVAFSYFDFDADTDELQSNLAGKTMSDESLSAVELESYRSKLTTPQGSFEYTLHQYDLQGSEGEKMLRGASFGYVSLKDSYVEIRGYCDEATHLDKLTLPLGIEAVKLVDANKVN